MPLWKANVAKIQYREWRMREHRFKIALRWQIVNTGETIKQRYFCESQEIISAK